ncbi:hypothetical protein [Lysinibacillus sp. FSL K6-3209]|uniref:hypothetical protein n=1 Tax=Lysinibacillus sp. FSL K6-3209 TaxID=2921497 RepID=UPI0030DC32D9
MLDLDKVFCLPMILAYYVCLILWILLLLALESSLLWALLNPLNFCLIFNIVFGITYQIKTKKRIS